MLIAGGKLTTYRSMGQQMVDVAERKLGKLTGKALVGDPHSDREALMAGGAAGMQEDLSAKAQAELSPRLPADIIEHLLHAYGSGYPHVVAILDEQPQLSERFASDLPYIKAEAVHAVRNEMAMTLTDVMSRRLHLLMEDRNQGLDAVEEIVALVGPELGWSVEEQQRQAAAYREEVARTRAYKA
jgi:glycerol-3-phosphate dehydrogenase